MSFPASNPPSLIPHAQAYYHYQTPLPMQTMHAAPSHVIPSQILPSSTKKPASSLPKKRKNIDSDDEDDDDLKLEDESEEDQEEEDDEGNDDLFDVGFSSSSRSLGDEVLTARQRSRKEDKEAASGEGLLSLEFGGSNRKSSKLTDEEKEKRRIEKNKKRKEEEAKKSEAAKNLLVAKLLGKAQAEDKKALPNPLPASRLAKVQQGPVYRTVDKQSFKVVILPETITDVKNLFVSSYSAAPEEECMYSY